MSFKKIDIQIQGIELDEELQKQVQKAKNMLNIDDTNLDIFLRIISGEKVNLCISNLFDIFKLSLCFKINNIIEILNQALLNVNNIKDICYILLNKQIFKNEEKFLLRFLQIGNMIKKLSIQIDQFIEDSHFLDFPTSSIFQILQESKIQNMKNFNLLYQKMMTSLTDNLCLLPFIDIFSLTDDQKQELFTEIKSIIKQIKHQNQINSENDQKSQSEQNDILKLQNIIKSQKEKYIKRIEEKEEIIKKLKVENENLQKGSNNLETTEKSNMQLNEEILKLKNYIDKQNEAYLNLKGENKSLRKQIINKQVSEKNVELNDNSNDEISNLRKMIINYKNEQQEKDEIIAKLKEENENLQTQLDQKTVNNNIMQSDEKELTDLYNLCKKYQSEIEKERMENEVKDETIQKLEKYKEAYRKEKEKNDINMKFILELQNENEKLKEENADTNSPSINNVKPHSAINSKPVNSIQDNIDIKSQNKSHKYHPPTSPKELRRIEIFKENQSIVENGFYTYKDKLTQKKVTKFIKTDLDQSISNTELISSNFPLKLDIKPLLKNEKLALFQKIEVWEASTFCEAIYMKKKVSNKVCVLNFASALQPGGGVLNGRNAQEEVLSRQSTLYFSLITKSDFYEHNKTFYDPLGTDYMIYSPNVMIIRDDDDELIEPVKVSVISAVAVNYSEIKSLYKKGEKDQVVYDKMKNRCRRILKLCLIKGNDVIILGAFGCGVFKNSPKMISEIFKELLIDESIGMFFKKVIFAIKTNPGKSNEVFQTFKNTLSVSTKKC